MIFGTYNELPLYFQLSVIICCLISYTNDVANGRHLGFLSFQILSKFERIILLKMMREQNLTIKICKIVRFLVKLSVFSHFLAKCGNYEVNDTLLNFVSYYDDVISYDVT